MSRATEITDQLRAADRAKEENRKQFGTAADKRKETKNKDQQREEREHLQ